jgi:hypothetical protein
LEEGGLLMATLHGKGVWLSCSANVDLAIEMAGEIGATHVIHKAGHGAMFFPAAVRRVRNQVRAAGLIPFAWLFLPCSNPAGEARVALKAAEAGYEGIVFELDEQSAGQQVNAKELGWRLLSAGLDSGTLFYTSLPTISRHSGIPYAEMDAFCDGGFMPQSFPTIPKPAEVVIHKMTYEEHARWSKAQGYSRPVYPVLAGYRDEHATERLAPEELAHWVDVLAEHTPTFFSVFHTAVTDRELWPALAGPVAPADVPEPAVLQAQDAIAAEPIVRAELTAPRSREPGEMEPADLPELAIPDSGEAESVSPLELGLLRPAAQAEVQSFDVSEPAISQPEESLDLPELTMPDSAEAESLSPLELGLLRPSSHAEADIFGSPELAISQPPEPARMESTDLPELEAPPQPKPVEVPPSLVYRSEAVPPPRPRPVTPPISAPPAMSEPVALQGEQAGEVYVTATPDDTVAGLCRKYGCTKAQFWEWNGHLWDDLWWPRDPDYMQVGWRVRVE